MPQLNFKVPFLNENGISIKQPKLDEGKIKYNDNGTATTPYLLDENGNPVMETVLISDVVFAVLNKQFPEDSADDFSSRAARGRLAVRVKNCETEEYTPEEIALIETLVAKGSSSVLFVSQVDAIINGNQLAIKAA